MSITTHAPAEFVEGLPGHVARMVMVDPDDLAALVEKARVASAPPLLIAGQVATQEAIDALIAWRDTHP